MFPKNGIPLKDCKWYSYNETTGEYEEIKGMGKIKSITLSPAAYTIHFKIKLVEVLKMIVRAIKRGEANET